jgi:serine/threonine-protein kinase
VEPPKNTPETAATERPPESGPGPIDAAARTEVQAKPPTKPGDPWIGRVLDERYRITERLGEGGMGAVFVAEHLKLRKQVALKMIRAELAGNGEVAIRFAREAMATAQFEHPHVASAIDYGMLPEGGAYLVMQRVRGRSLRELMESQGKLPWWQACELLAQVADALSAARGAGIVHRDLKPENILVETREDGSQLAKILDFGIAHVMPHASAVEPHSRELTRIGTVMGTPGYMSPEQAVGDKVDHRTDLYALGVVLWECVAGRPLWDGPDITTIISRQMTNEVPRLRDVPQVRVPRALDDLIQRLTARSADARPDHAGGVRDSLRALAHAPRLQERSFDVVREGWESARRQASALPSHTRMLLGLGAVAAVLAVLALSSGTPTQPTAAKTPESGAAPSGAGVTPATDQPTLVQRAMNAARNVVQPAPEPPKAIIPAELAEPVKTMQESERSTERRKAALRVLAYKGPARLPPHIRAIAQLEQARSCKDRKEAIGAMVALKDARCLDSLRRYNDSSHTGCGFLSLEDCYGCIRNDLRKGVAAIEGKAAE